MISAGLEAIESTRNGLLPLSGRARQNLSTSTGRQGQQVLACFVVLAFPSRTATTQKRGAEAADRARGECYIELIN